MTSRAGGRSRPLRSRSSGRPSATLGRLAHPSWGGGLPLRAMAPISRPPSPARAATARGAVKATFGTGVFVLANAGPDVPATVDGLLTTIAWTDPAGRPTYALDGGVFSAGALLGWLADGIGVLDAATDLDAVAGSVDDAGGVRILPALGGLGAPWWEPRARAVIAGLTAATARGHLARAALDSIAQRTTDVVEAMLPPSPRRRRRSGSTAASPRAGSSSRASPTSSDARSTLPPAPESTALGIGLLAAIGAGRLDDAGAAEVAATDRRVEPHPRRRGPSRAARRVARLRPARRRSRGGRRNQAVPDDPSSTSRRTTG